MACPANLWCGKDESPFVGQRYVGTGELQYARTPPLLFGVSPLLHAFNVSLAELLAASERLNAAGIQTQNFAGEKTTEPSVIGWMPSAQLYFRDRDGHSLEFIALLDESPEPEFVGSLSEWKKRSRAA